MPESINHPTYNYTTFEGQGDFDSFPAGPRVGSVAPDFTAILLDTDTIFHGVDRVAETAAPVDRLRAGMKLCFAGGGEWAVTDGDHEIARYPWSALRFSISWKAYCFADEAEQRAWREHADDLLVAAVVDRLLADMRRRGALGEDEQLSDHDLVERIIDTYIHFPPAHP